MSTTLSRNIGNVCILQLTEKYITFTDRGVPGKDCIKHVVPDSAKQPQVIMSTTLAERTYEKGVATPQAWAAKNMLYFGSLVSWPSKWSPCPIFDLKAWVRPLASFPPPLFFPRLICTTYAPRNHIRPTAHEHCVLRSAGYTALYTPAVRRQSSNPHHAV